VAGALLAAAAIWLLASAEWTPDALLAGEPAPGFELPRLADGEPISLEAQRGRVVLINFWATWCKPCEDEMPAMQRLYERLQGRGFELLAVSVDDSRDEVERFRQRLELDFPILLDPRKRVAGRYQSFRFPESWLVDREGRLVARFIGPREWDAPAYVQRIEGLLEGGDAPGPAADREAGLR
jgi:peroxiredoxin